MSSAERLPVGVARVRAPNPSVLTLDGTNTYLAAGWVIDPGPADERHQRAVAEAAGGRAEGIALTHGHPDHAAGAARLAELLGDIPVTLPVEEVPLGPFEVLATPGHSRDHVTLLLGPIAFAGDLVLGRGSVFIDPNEGSLTDYLASLRRLRGLGLEAICPGHGPVVDDPSAKLDEYLAHRLARERALVAALDAGARGQDELLDAAWPDVGPQLRAAAGLSLRAHLHKLADERRLPPGMASGLVD